MHRHDSDSPVMWQLIQDCGALQFRFRNHLSAFESIDCKYCSLHGFTYMVTVKHLVSPGHKWYQTSEQLQVPFKASLVRAEEKKRSKSMRMPSN